MPSQTKFQKDLAAGEKGERHVATTLKKYYGASSVSTVGKCKGFDFRLIFPQASELYECKVDFKAAATQNIFLEFECSGKDAGLASTVADKYAILVPHLNEILVFVPRLMMSYLKSSTHKIAKGGDGYRVRGYILPIKTAKEIAFVSVVPTSTRIAGPKAA